MIITTLTMQVAEAIMSGPKWELHKFYDKGSCCQYYCFTHYNFYYSYPAFGKQWSNGKDYQFHRVETKCTMCDFKPQRNYAGIGSLYLLHNGVSDERIYTCKIEGKKQKFTSVLNTPRLTQMILLCPDHVGSYFPFEEFKPLHKKPIQLQLF